MEANGDPRSTAARSPALPSRELCVCQAEWLRDARARLLRRAAIARRRHVVDLGAGWGLVSEELARRSGGQVTAVDCHAGVPDSTPPAEEQAVAWRRARAEELPLSDACCDLVFTQFAFLWFDDPRRAACEASRILQPGGAVAAIEPDFGGLIEHPPETALRSIWIAAIEQAGGDPLIGRRLPGLLADAGLAVEVQLTDRLKPPDPARFDLLAELPLTPQQRDALQRARAAADRAGSQTLAHLPVMMIYAEKTGLSPPA